MALKLKDTAEAKDRFGNIYNGGLYLVVDSIELNKARKFGHISVDIYISKKARDEGAEPIITTGYTIKEEEWDEIMQKNKDGHYKDPFEIAYDYVKSLNEVKEENGEKKELKAKMYKDWESDEDE